MRIYTFVHSFIYSFGFFARCSFIIVILFFFYCFGIWNAVQKQMERGDGGGGGDMKKSNERWYKSKIVWISYSCGVKQKNIFWKLNHALHMHTL